MTTQTFNCPTCGASLASSETNCRYCGSRLARIACPACFAMMFVGSRFCPHCGAATQEPKPVEQPALHCPDCKVPMEQILLGQTVLRECARCHGFWVDADSFRRICAEGERQADVLRAASPAPPAAPPRIFRYRACPCCKRLMNRYNFANASRIVIDSCKGHGVWFERDELRRIIEFLRAGGMEIVKQRQREHDAEKQRWIQSQRHDGRDEDGWSAHGFPSGLSGLSIDL